jgi:membrane protein implicated in regulation of membrane protease activity
MNAQWLFGWWNLVFIVPFGLAMLYLGVYTISGWTFGETDVDADHDFDAPDQDADFEADHDVDADADADADHDADHDTDTEHDAETSGASGAGHAIWAALSFLGVGKVPVSIVAMILFLTWGGVGFAANQLVHDSVSEPWQVAMISLPIAACASLLLTGGTSRMINRYVPLNVTTAKRRHELLGSTGEVILPIDAKFGMANVRDASGDLFQVPCRLEDAGDGTMIPKGARVKLVAYNARELLFYVLPDVSVANVTNN